MQAYHSRQDSHQQWQRPIQSKRPPMLCLFIGLWLSSQPLWAQQPAPYAYEALSPNDEAYLATQRERVNTLLQRRLGSKLSGQRDADLQRLQQLLDSGAVRADQTASLQAMGVVLGDYLGAELGMVWVVVRDDNGRHRALASERGQLLYPINTIVQQRENGRRVDVNALYQQLTRR